jgi:protein-disulfide isomerase
MSNPSFADVQAAGGRRSWTLLLLAVVLSVAAFGLSAAALTFALGLAGKGETPVDINSQVRAYILANPEIIVEAVNQLEARREETEANELTAFIASASDEIFNDPASPVGGNPGGDVTLVEFFDYNCHYCRKAAPVLAELEAGDRGLRIVYKEFPILGPGSEFAARAALASRKQDKYLDFHKAMMSHAGRIDEGSVLEIAAGLGLNVDLLKKDMADPAIAQAISGNLALAQKLRITGTPGFVAGKEIVRGLAPLRSMKDLIGKARQ